MRPWTQVLELRFTPKPGPEREHAGWRQGRVSMVGFCGVFSLKYGPKSNLFELYPKYKKNVFV